MEWLFVALAFLVWIAMKAWLGWRMRNQKPPTPTQAYKQWKD